MPTTADLPKTFNACRLAHGAVKNIFSVNFQEKVLLPLPIVVLPIILAIPLTTILVIILVIVMTMVAMLPVLSLLAVILLLTGLMIDMIRLALCVQRLICCTRILAIRLEG